MSLPIHVLARHRARPETVDDVRQILLSLIAPSRAEPGCLKYELLQNADDPTDFTFVETFASDEALKEHAVAPYITNLAAKLEGLVARPAEVSRYRAIAADPDLTTSAS
jgi:quinol monooxygenase YgiN